MKKIMVLGALLLLTACASTTPLPQCVGEFTPINQEQLRGEN